MNQRENRESERMDKDKKNAVGTGVGAAAGAAAGAAVGTVVPGVGNVVGALVGGAIGLAGGAAAGRAIASIDPDAEDEFWRNNYNKRTYAAGATYDDFGPAYRYGWETRSRYPAERRFDDVESELKGDWDSQRGSSNLSWDRAKHASREAWERIERSLDDASRRETRH